MENFEAQLERSYEYDLPYWRINLTTKSQTTGKAIKRALVKSLERLTERPVDFKIDVKKKTHLHELCSENIFQTSSDLWSESYFDNKTCLKNIYHKNILGEKICQKI